MLDCDGLTLARGSFRLSADWSVPAGASVAVIGPSGAGKSLLLGAIAGFETVAAGIIRWQGRNLTALPPRDRPVTIMFQDHNLFPHITAAENVALGLAPNRQPTGPERARVAEALAEVGLPGLGDRLPAELSGGQRSRVALARALVRARPVLLLDEPFAALGPGLRREMLTLVTRIAAEQGTTWLYVTHLPEEAAPADLAVFVGDGLATAPVPPARLFADPPAALRDYL